MGSMTLEEASSNELSIGNIQYHSDAGFVANIPLPENLSPLNITAQDDTAFNIPIFHSISQCHP